MSAELEKLLEIALKEGRNTHKSISQIIACVAVQCYKLGLVEGAKKSG